jgi:uncharacterized membrane protein YeaQ/YmgE (transglycosylase-associated protein family)
VGIIAFIILGLLAGAIAKALLPGDDPGGFIITALIGVAGALIGGFLAGALFDADPMDEFFDASTWLTAIIGSIILLLIYRLFTGRRSAFPSGRLDGEGLAAAREPAYGGEPPVVVAPRGTACGADIQGGGLCPTTVCASPSTTSRRQRFPSGRLDGEGLAAAREPAYGGEPPVVVAPDVRLHRDRALRALVDLEPAGFPATLRARLSQPGGDRDGRTTDVSVDHLELVSFADGALVNVAGENELGPRVDEPREDVRAPRDRLLPRAPGCTDQVVMEDGDPQRARRGLREELACPGQLPLANAARLVPPGAYGVEPDDLKRGRGVHRLRPLPVSLELVEGLREARGERVRDVVVARDSEYRRAEPAKKGRRGSVLLGPPAVRQVAARHHELGPGSLNKGGQAGFDLGRFARPDVEVRDVQ